MLKCSRCQIPLCHIDYNGAHVHVCPDCRGLLVGAESLRDIARRRDTSGKGEVEGSAVPARQSGRPGRIRCPKCLAEMSDVSVRMADDTYRVCSCTVCNVCWLDLPELQRAQNLYEKEQQSRKPQDWARVERALLAQMALREEAEQLGEGQRISEEMLPGVGLASINRWWLVARAARLLLRLVARV